MRVFKNFPSRTVNEVGPGVIAHRLIPLSLPCRNRKDEGTLSKVNRGKSCVTGNSYVNELTL